MLLSSVLATMLAMQILTTDAGPDQTVTQPVINQPTPVTLSGTVRENGTIAPDGVKRTWTVVSGPSTAVTFDDPNRAITTAHLPVPGTYVLRLSAVDGAPVPTITQPLSGQQFRSKVYIAADGTDDVNVVKIDIYADGKILATGFSNKMAVSWNIGAGNIKLGAHTVTAKVWDTVGLTATVNVTIYKVK